jgi:hypothetical protein
MNITLQLPIQETKKGWEGSPLVSITRLNNQHKGSLGTSVVKQVMEAAGETCKVISDRGDLDTSKGRSEVKFATATYTSNSSESFWWNQVRPKQEGWDYLHLVGFARDRVLVWELTKEEFLSLGSVVGDGHVEGEGAGTLKEVKVVKNSRTDTIALLDEYLIATIPASDVTLN